MRKYRDQPEGGRQRPSRSTARRTDLDREDGGRPAAPRPSVASEVPALLGLQASVGNHAVAAIVARSSEREPVQRTNEPPEIEAALAAIDALLDPEALAGTTKGHPPAVQPSREALVQRQGPGEEPKPKPGKPGDVVEALAKTEPGKQAIQILNDKAKHAVVSLSTGEKVTVVTALFAIGGGALAGAMSDPQARRFMLEQASGKEVPVPGVRGLSMKVDLGKDGVPTGGMLLFDVGSVLPPSLGFKEKK
jgi:hypothetical protein